MNSKELIDFYWNQRRDLLDQDRISSLDVARLTNKRHHFILRDIDDIISKSKLSTDSRAKYRNKHLGVVLSDVDSDLFTLYTRQDTGANNRSTRCYSLSKRGFLLLLASYDADIRLNIIDDYLNER